MSGNEVYAKLWELLHDEKNGSGYYDVPEIEGWLGGIVFPALVGEGHCHRCHGFEDGPCHDEHDGHHGCPPCATQRNLEQLAMTAPSKPIHLVKEQQHCVLCASGEHQRITFGADLDGLLTPRPGGEGERG